MRNSIVLALTMSVSLMSVSAMAVAAEEARVGVETRDWTALQAAGTAASATERPMPGEIAERVYKRYADSYSHPIPEKLTKDSFATESGSK